MRTYPWSSKNKLSQELTEALEESKDPSTIKRIDCVETFFEEIRNSKTPWYLSWKWSIEHWVHDVSWNVYRWFVPCHKPVRDAVPRRWTDCTQLILDVNFAIIKEFVEEEMNNVVWDDPDRTQVFEAGVWLRDSYEYITKERALLEEKYNEALASKDNLPLETRKAMTYDQKYGEANRIEQEIADKDEQVIMGLAKHRQWMWS